MKTEMITKLQAARVEFERAFSRMLAAKIEAKALSTESKAVYEAGYRTSMMGEMVLVANPKEMLILLDSYRVACNDSTNWYSPQVVEV